MQEGCHGFEAILGCMVAMSQKKKNVLKQKEKVIIPDTRLLLKVVFLLQCTKVLKLFCHGSVAAVKTLLHIVEEIISNQIMEWLT